MQIEHSPNHVVMGLEAIFLQMEDIEIEIIGIPPILPRGRKGLDVSLRGASRSVKELSKVEDSKRRPTEVDDY